jgi:hypothetical protein
MKRILILGTAIGLAAGCTDQLPTDTVDEPATAAMAQQVNLDERTAALAGIEDGLDRIVPALSDETAARPLAAALAGLRNALANADGKGAPALIDAAAEAVDRYARTGLDNADLDALRLGLDYMREVVSAAS